MAGKEISDGKVKRHRKRKARTQVSISPESSDHDASKAPSKAPASALVEKQPEENTDAPPISKNKTRKSKKRKEVETAEPAEEAIGETQETESKPSAKDDTAPASFESYYLRMATSEFAEDLDKVRIASDFRDASLPMLVKALQQGASIFSMEEKRMFMAGERRKDGWGL